MTALRIEEVPDGARFAVSVQPRAARAAIRGLQGDALRVQVMAPPVDGAANAALVELLASALGVARRDVTIVSGATSRRKLIHVTGVSPAAIVALVQPE